MDNTPVTKPTLTDTKVARDSTRNQNFNGRRITGAANAQAPQDYTTLNDVTTTINSPSMLTIINNAITNFLKGTINVLGTVIFGNLDKSLPLKLDASKHVISAKIDLTQVNDVAGAVNFQIPVGVTGGFLSFTNQLTWSGTQFVVGTVTPWTSSFAQFHTAADHNLAITSSGYSGGVLSDGVAIHSFDDAVANAKGLEIRASNLLLGISGKNVGFYGGTPVAKQVLSAYSTNAQSSAYTSTPASLAFAATLADLNTLRLAYENLRLAYDDLRTKLQTTTLVG